LRDDEGILLCRAVFSLFAKTMRVKSGQLEDGGAELGV
jgi:hypothetical protein